MSISLAGQLPTLSPPVFLAPMAGITDLPFRRLVARFGAGLVVSEMVASREMVQAHVSTRAKARTEVATEPGTEPGTERGTEPGTPAGGNAGGAPMAVQIAGREAHWMAEAARVAEAGGAPIIDINMGCPAKKVTGGLSGSALMRDPDHALRLIEAVVAAVRVPVTLKMRLGWDEGSVNAPELARRAEAAGVRMITVHGRTRCQFYKGRADWAAIGAVRAAVGVPVIANGDITGPATARSALAASGAAGVMIGRGAQGRPWLPAQIAAALHGTPAPHVPHGAALADLVAGHYEEMLSFYGAALGMRVARKHLGWYLEAAGAERAAIRPVLVAETPGLAMRLVRGALCALAVQPEAEAAA